ncbi:hypothetical protein PYCCODRAFT_1433051 [Trametes coccinea BRFM310]|uniref:Uncharacterized protein n=1 Tax=Trametes coccinea (strain BRFM310) TaxID=1353009 RepID=A0A1Y2IWX9_TRAC3|nr:hypothetical protein PYCCODRAFT_1433051 [Trametes coccinea BRFM310]
MPMLIDTAELAGLAAEAALYGVFLCLFCVCGYDLVERRRRLKTQLSWPMVLAGVLLILLATARFIVDCCNIFVAFIHHDPREARLAYLQDVTQPLFTTKHCIFITTLLVGDSFVNFRCWIVWGKNIWVIVIPVIFSLVSTASGSYTMWAYGHLPNQTIHSEADWLTVLFSLSLVANALATSLLAYRIWSVDRQTRDALPSDMAGTSKLSPLVRIIAESGVINAGYLFVFVMTLEFGSQALEIMSEMAVPLTGIIFSIVILRVGHQQHGDSFYATRPAGGATISWAVKRGTVAPSVTATTLTVGGNAYAESSTATMYPLQVYVQRSEESGKQPEDGMLQNGHSERDSLSGCAV